MVLKKIVCLGAGYVGGTTMAVIAQKVPGVQVTVIDTDEEKIAAWNSNELPIFEPGLKEIIDAHIGKNLYFVASGPCSKAAVMEADVIFFAIGAPTKCYGTGAGKALMLGHFESAVRNLIGLIKPGAIIVEKSTVPVGVADIIKSVLNANMQQNQHYEVLSNPEFMSEGTAIKDLYCPNRVLVGHDKTQSSMMAARVIFQLYNYWVPAERILLTSVWSSELSKLASSAFLAQRVSSINSIAALCERTGADVREISRAIGADSRIGNKFVEASIGFGGSSFRKDILSLMYIAESFQLNEVSRYFEQILKINEFSINRFANSIVQAQFGTLLHKKIAIFGFAFKANTGDTRESPAISLISLLINEGAIVSIFDPVVRKKDILREMGLMKSQDCQFMIAPSAYDCASDSHAIVIMTEWSEFSSLDYQKIYNSMMKPAFIFDGRNLLSRQKLREIGFCTSGIGSVPDKRPA